MTYLAAKRELEALVRASGSLRKAAKGLGCSPSYLSDVLARGKPIGPKLLHAIGYTASRSHSTTYTKKKD